MEFLELCGLGVSVCRGLRGMWFDGYGCDGEMTGVFGSGEG